MMVGSENVVVEQRMIDCLVVDVENDEALIEVEEYGDGEMIVVVVDDDAVVAAGYFDKSFLG